MKKKETKMNNLQYIIDECSIDKPDVYYDFDFCYRCHLAKDSFFICIPLIVNLTVYEGDKSRIDTYYELKLVMCKDCFDKIREKMDHPEAENPQYHKDVEKCIEEALKGERKRLTEEKLDRRLNEVNKEEKE